VDALTYGLPSIKQSLKDAPCRGTDRVRWIQDPTAKRADAHVTATVLAAAIRKLGPYDLIICGEFLITNRLLHA
jgi:electron transfer flavoprotein beta subunit